MLYTKYESPGPSSFRQEDFFKKSFENLFFDPVTYMYLCNQSEPFEQFRQSLCWILIARYLNINKNILHRPEVQRISAPKSPKCDSSSTGMFK